MAQEIGDPTSTPLPRPRTRSANKAAMQPKNQKQEAKKSSRYFCGFKRSVRLPNTMSSEAPPQNAIPVSTTPTQQRLDHGNSSHPANIAPLPSRQTVTSQPPTRGQPSQVSQPHTPQSGDNMFGRPLQAVPLRAPAPWIHLSQSSPSHSRPSHISPLQVTNSNLIPSSPKQAQLPSTPKLSPAFFPKFTRLPREIRDLIWLQMLRDLSLSISLPVPLPINQIRKALPAFCHVSRQVFCETVPLFLQARSIELGSKEDAKKLFQFLNHVPDGEAYRGVRSLKFANCWAWTSASAIPLLREVLANCNCVRHITLEVTQKFIYEPLYYGPSSYRLEWSEHRKSYIKTHLLPDLHRLFLHDATSLKTVRLRGSGKHDALQSSYLARGQQAEEWLKYFEWSGTVDDPKPPDALLDMKFAEWKDFVESKGGECSQWMENLVRKISPETCNASHFTGPSSYSSTSPRSGPTKYEPPDPYSASGFTSGDYMNPRPTIFESSDYYSPSGFESESYDESGFESPRSRDRPSGFWSSGALSPGHRSSKPNYRPNFIRPGL